MLESMAVGRRFRPRPAWVGFPIGESIPTFSARFRSVLRRRGYRRLRSISLPGILRIERAHSEEQRAEFLLPVVSRRENPIRRHPLKLPAASFGQPDVVDLGQLVQPVAKLAPPPAFSEGLLRRYAEKALRCEAFGTYLILTLGDHDQAIAHC